MGKISILMTFLSLAIGLANFASAEPLYVHVGNSIAIVDGALAEKIRRLVGEAKRSSDMKTRCDYFDECADVYRLLDLGGNMILPPGESIELKGSPSFHCLVPSLRERASYSYPYPVAGPFSRSEVIQCSTFKLSVERETYSTTENDKSYEWFVTATVNTNLAIRFGSADLLQNDSVKKVDYIWLTGQ